MTDVGVPEPRRAVRLRVDGNEVLAPEGATLANACRLAGAEVPTLCWGDTLRPRSACRVCVVEVDGSRTLVPSCSRPVADGMVVHTSSPRVRHARRMVLEFLASSTDLTITPDVARWMADYGADPGRYGPDAARADSGPILDNDLYVRDYDRCILCYKCVDACGEQWQNSFAIAVAGRGSGAHVSTEWSAPLTASACVYCGNCIEVCPTGALQPVTEFERRADGRWDESAQAVTDTICPYCGVGCTLRLHVADGEIVKVTSPHDHSITHGNLCIKGRFGWRHVHNR